MVSGRCDGRPSPAAAVIEARGRSARGETFPTGVCRQGSWEAGEWENQKKEEAGTKMFCNTPNVIGLNLRRTMHYTLYIYIYMKENVTRDALTHGIFFRA